MTREEAEGLIAAFERSTTIGMKDLLVLARLGAKVMAPTRDELQIMSTAYWAYDNDQYDDAIEPMRAALSSLQEPQP